MRLKIAPHSIACLLVSMAPAPRGSAEEYRLHEFERLELSSTFYAEGATYGDVSGDGAADIIAGPYWYEGPAFAARHEIYTPKEFDPRGYSDNFFAFLEDFDRDGWQDVLVIGFPGKDASWYRNPRGAAGHWERHVVFDTVDNESPTFTDLTGDGRPEIVCSTGGRFGYVHPDWGEPAKKWTFVAISENRGAGRFTHGLGVGDVDGDGRMDILEKDGWYEQPESLEGNPIWTHHPFPFASPRGGAQMFAVDVDGDGDNDVITSLHAHGWGLAWYEHIREDGAIRFRRHVILEPDGRENAYGVSFAQLHAIDLADMDGDGLLDIVTGKRIWAHFGEPSAEKPAVLYWFQLVRRDGGADFVPHRIDDASGVGTQVVAGDVDADGLPDVVVANKTGTFLLLHKTRSVSRGEWLRARPRALPAAGLSPEDAAAVMEAPEGFQVELVAAEPDVHQPVAFAIDARGRLWIAEAHTYPVRVKGREGKWNEGRDRIVVLEDTDLDGRFETRKVFAEGLNLVSGLEVGFGGVWIGAAPYFLFFPDADGDDRPDGPPEILLDGWGFQDTHETLNSFIWGPDGWLYGCHGVFTHSHVGKPGTPPAERTPVNAAVWRYHPLRHEFEVFAWGTSNPWGVDFNDHGQAFLTACVIPHFYHMVQGARYERQGGRHFNPYIYDDIKTIADHRHYAGDIRDHAWWGQEPTTPADTLAAGGGHAHCGAMVYLGDNFPSRYRNTVFMHNIHGNRVNNDIPERRGSGYVARHGKDFLLANDRWFRGINLKYGPDGGVYLIDWYDKNACHRTQSEIWDRSNGRAYKVTYGNVERVRVDLAALDDRELVELQLHPNDWYVRAARRLLQERGGSHDVHARLREILREHPDATRKLRALWALHVTGGLGEELALEALASPEEYVRAWTVQLALEKRSVSQALLERLGELGREDPSPVVRLYLASALGRVDLDSRWELAGALAARAEDASDHNLPLLLWYGVEPLAASRPEKAMELARASRMPLLTRFITRRIAENVRELEPILSALVETEDAERTLLILDEMLRAFEGHVGIPMPAGWTPVYQALAQSPSAAVRERAQAVAVKFGDRRAFPYLREAAADAGAPLEKRRRALEILLDGNDAEAVPLLEQLLDDPALRSAAVRGLAAYDDPRVPAAILERYPSFPPAEKADAVTTLSSRPSFAKALLEAVGKGSVPRTDLSAFIIRQIRGLADAGLDKAVEEVWGTVRATSADRKAAIEEAKRMLAPELLAAGDLPRGRAVFARTCAQCHTLFGSGAKVAPDLTGSDRANLDYILENILDPNAVVGKDYLMSLFITRDGRIVTGLVEKETESGIVVRTVNEEVVVPKKDILRREATETSLMPEDLLAALSKEEVRDLIAYLASPVDVPMRGSTVAIDPQTHRVTGAIEGEAMEILEKTRGSARPQDMRAFGQDKWSGNVQLWWTDGRPGDRLVLALPVKQRGSYRLEVALTQARDYGRVRFELDGSAVGEPIDLYHPNVVPTGPLVLGELELEAGTHRLAVEITGAHPQAVQAYMFGLDYVLLSAPVAE